MIREDLLNKIKEIYGIKKISYIGVEKNIYTDECPLLLFATDKNLISIRRGLVKKEIYHLEIMAKDQRFGYYYIRDHKSCILRVKENETILTNVSAISDTIVYKFPGVAFDFTKEFVVAALEEEWKHFWEKMLLNVLEWQAF